VCLIPAGQYPIGDDAHEFSRPAHHVASGAFAIGVTTVTNALFALFVGDGGYRDPRWWGDHGWRWQAHKQAEAPAFWDDPAFNAPMQPVVGVCWYEALAFVRWLADQTGDPWRLPSEIEFEIAARGTGPIQPLPPEQINSAEHGIGRPWPVDHPAASDSWCGARDLLGNVWEWTSTRWGRSWQSLEYRYPYDPTDGREDLTGSHARVMRGGSWFDPLAEAHPAARGRYLPGSRGSNIGFRLARAVE